MGKYKQIFNSASLKKLAIVFVFTLLATGCKKEKDNPPQSGGPAVVAALNGWSYLGKTNLLPYSADNSYNLYLAKVHQHGSNYYDVFCGVKYKMLNYFGSGSGYFINSTRWVLKADGTTQRNVENSPEFIKQTTGMLYEPLYSTSGDVVGYIHPIDVKVLGTGQGEFRCITPVGFTRITILQVNWVDYMEIIT